MMPARTRSGERELEREECTAYKVNDILVVLKSVQKFEVYCLIYWRAAARARGARTPRSAVAPARGRPPGDVNGETAYPGR